MRVTFNGSAEPLKLVPEFSQDAGESRLEIGHYLRLNQSIAYIERARGFLSQIASSPTDSGRRYQLNPEL